MTLPEEATKDSTEDLLVTSGFGYNSHQPFVEIRLNGERVTTFTPAKAREIAGMLMHSAEAADQDGFIFSWFGKIGDLDVEQRMIVMLEFRQYRDAQDGRR